MTAIRRPILLGALMLALVLAALQNGLPGLLSSYDGARVFEVGVVVLGLLLVRQVRAPARWNWVCAGLLMVGGVSAAVSSYPALAMKEVLLWSGLILLAPRVAAIRPGALKGLGLFLVTAQLIWTADLLVFWAQPHFLGTTFDPGAFNPVSAGFTHFSNPRFLNQFQSWMLPVASLLCLRLRAPRSVRLICWGLLVVSWSQLWLSMGRGSLLGLFTGGTVVAVLLGSEGRRFAVFQAGLAAAGWALYLLLFRVLSPPEVFRAVTDKGLTTTGRVPAWSRSIEMFVESPLLGRGPQSFGWEGVRFGHPHSAPLQLLAEWGALGALAVTIVLLWGARSAVSLWRSGSVRMARRPWFVAVTMSSVAAAVHSLVSGVLVMPLSHLGFVIVVATWLRISGSRVRRDGPTLAMAVGLGLLSIVAAGLLLPELVIPGLGPTSMEFDSESLQGFTRPRFWGDGL